LLRSGLDVSFGDVLSFYEDDDGLSDERKGENSSGRKRKNNLIVFSYRKIWTDSKAIEILENLKTGLNVID